MRKSCGFAVQKGVKLLVHIHIGFSECLLAVYESLWFARFVQLVYTAFPTTFAGYHLLEQPGFKQFTQGLLTKTTTFN